MDKKSLIENKIIANLKNYGELEGLYQTRPSHFISWLTEALQHYPDSEALQVWNARINYKKTGSGQGENSSSGQINFIILLSFLSFFLVKLPFIFTAIPEEWFAGRFYSIIIIGSLICYFLKNRVQQKKQKIGIIFTLLCSTLFMGLLLPYNNTDSDSILMAEIYMLLFLFTVLGSAFMAGEWREDKARISFIRYLGEMIIYTAIILLGGIVLTIITIDLFETVGFYGFADLYIDNIVPLGLVAAPIVATCLYDTVLKERSNIANLIANIFAPLFLITVVFYLLTLLFALDTPYSNREFFIILNGLLVIIWCITVFSIAGGEGEYKRESFSSYITLSLIIATITLNAISLSAVFFRIFAYGISPNKTVVIGSNILLFVHLILICISYKNYCKNTIQYNVLIGSITRFLPIYTLWSFVVIIILPILFQYK